jgi:hypothetical protein
MDAVTQAILDQLSSDDVAKIAKTVGANKKKTSSALSTVLPVLVSGLAGNAVKPAGAASLFDAVAKDHDGSLLDNIADFLGNPASADGAGILGHVLGAKQPKVEKGIAEKTGLNVGQIAQLLQIAAPLVMAYLGKKQRKDKLGADDLASMLGDQLAADKEESGLLDVLGSVRDSEKHGSAVDELMDLMGGMLKGGAKPKKKKG